LTVTGYLRSNGDEKRRKNAVVIHLPLFRSEPTTIAVGYALDTASLSATTKPAKWIDTKLRIL
jgi:hypothetical protein